jgi:hypothetical protein
MTPKRALSKNPHQETKPRRARVEPATSDIASGGLGAVMAIALIKALDKIPWVRLIGREKKEPSDPHIRKSEMTAALVEHEKECRKCLDERFAKTQEVDQRERREFRGEVLNRLEKLAERIDRILERQ